MSWPNDESGCSPIECGGRAGLWEEPRVNARVLSWDSSHESCFKHLVSAKLLYCTVLCRDFYSDEDCE